LEAWKSQSAFEKLAVEISENELEGDGEERQELTKLFEEKIAKDTMAWREREKGVREGGATIAVVVVIACSHQGR